MGHSVIEKKTEQKRDWGRTEQIFTKRAGGDRLGEEKTKGGWGGSGVAWCKGEDEGALRASQNNAILQGGLGLTVTSYPKIGPSHTTHWEFYTPHCPINPLKR